MTITHPVTEEAKLATAFLATLPDAQTPWADKFNAWAAEQGLDEATAPTTKVTILRLRMVAAVEAPPAAAEIPAMSTATPTREVFRREHIAWLDRLAFEAAFELLARELEEAEADLGWRDAGIRYAALLRLPKYLAPMVAIMILSADREHRRRAADVICRAVQRRAKAA